MRRKNTKFNFSPSDVFIFKLQVHQNPFSAGAYDAPQTLILPLPILFLLRRVKIGGGVVGVGPSL